MFLVNPLTGKLFFGIIPQIKTKHRFFPEGEIWLPQGTKRYGAVHIFEVHQKEFNLSSLDDVPILLSRMIVRGSPLYDEGCGMTNPRVTILKSAMGLVIVELKPENRYHVVTAYAKKNPHGVQIGRIA